MEIVDRKGPAMTAPRGERVMKKVLIIDDDPTVRDLVASLLRRKGFVALQAGNGEEAITLLSTARREDGQSEYDLILLDLVMPKLSGWGVLMFIERSLPELVKHVVVISAESESQLQELEKRGVCGSLPKPFDVEAFYEAIARCTRSARSSRYIRGCGGIFRAFGRLGTIPKAPRNRHSGRNAAPSLVIPSS
jgi:two-component system response regulator ResD